MTNVHLKFDIVFIRNVQFSLNEIKNWKEDTRRKKEKFTPLCTIAPMRHILRMHICQRQSLVTLSQAFQNKYTATKTPNVFSFLIKNYLSQFYTFNYIKPALHID